MKGPVRRVVFNPTSIPELRTRAFTQSTRTIPGRQAIKPKLWAWTAIRNETTVIGKDASGHIETQANEAILFFDSEFGDFCQSYNETDTAQISTLCVSVLDSDSPCHLQPIAI